MRIIDERGRILGKINIIDFLAVLFLFFILPFFYYGFKLYRQTKITSAALKNQYLEQKHKAEFPEFNFDCLFLNVNEKTSELIKEGDKDVNQNGTINAVIIKINNAGYDKSGINTKETSRNIPVVLKLVCHSLESKLYYQDNPVLYYKEQTYTFNAKQYQLKFIIIPGHEVAKREKESPLNKDALLEEIKRIAENGRIFDKRIQRVENITRDMENTINFLKQNKIEPIESNAKGKEVKRK